MNTHNNNQILVTKFSENLQRPLTTVSCCQLAINLLNEKPGSQNSWQGQGLPGHIPGHKSPEYRGILS